MLDAAAGESAVSATLPHSTRGTRRVCSGVDAAGARSVLLVRLHRATGAELATARRTMPARRPAARVERRRVVRCALRAFRVPERRRRPRRPGASRRSCRIPSAAFRQRLSPSRPVVASSASAWCGHESEPRPGSRHRRSRVGAQHFRARARPPRPIASARPSTWLGGPSGDSASAGSTLPRAPPRTSAIAGSRSGAKAARPYVGRKSSRRRAHRISLRRGLKRLKSVLRGLLGERSLRKHTRKRRRGCGRGVLTRSRTS